VTTVSVVAGSRQIVAHGTSIRALRYSVSESAASPVWSLSKPKAVSKRAQKQSWNDQPTYGSRGSFVDPLGPETGSDRVLRGGCWCNYAEYCRSANRNYVTPGDRGCRVGFRLVFVP